LNFTIPRGATGATGSQGSQGPSGPANTLSIGTVSTGSAGSSASATITGTAPSQTLNLTIPKGDTGATGPTSVNGIAISPSSVTTSGDVNVHGNLNVTGSSLTLNPTEVNWPITGLSNAWATMGINYSNNNFYFGANMDGNGNVQSTGYNGALIYFDTRSGYQSQAISFYTADQYGTLVLAASFGVNGEFLAAGNSTFGGSATYANGAFAINSDGSFSVNNNSGSDVDGNFTSTSINLTGQAAFTDLTNYQAGTIYFNTTNHHFYGFNGTTWKQLDN
jgi:hypothetical protein